VAVVWNTVNGMCGCVCVVIYGVLCHRVIVSSRRWIVLKEHCREFCVEFSE
jgi:hypothetical protein